MPRRYIGPRPGRHQRMSDVGAKSRAYPGGAARSRLNQALWPPTIEDLVASWLVERYRVPLSSPAAGRESSTPIDESHDPRAPTPDS